MTDVTELIVDCEHKTAPTQETGYPSIRTPNIGKGHLILEGVNRVSEETYQLWTKRAKPKPGDLILAREAPAGNIGVIPTEEMVCLGQRTVLIRPNSEILDSHYLAILLLHPVMQSRLLARSVGATVEHVNMRDIRALGLGELPSIRDQREIVNLVLGVQRKSEQIVDIAYQKITLLDELKQSLLHKAFTGQLTADPASTPDQTIPEAA